MLKIIIIKLGAKGDVVRTLPIILGIKEKYPDSEIIWVTKKSSEGILKNIGEISKLYVLPYSTNEKFDILYNFDIEQEALDLASKINAVKKYGFYSEDDFPMAFNMAGEYYLNTVFDDEIKKSNKKTYQEMMFEISELDYKKQHYLFPLTEKEKTYAENFIKNHNLENKKIIGIHVGSGPRWPSKAWSEQKILEFIKLADNIGYKTIFFAGSDEKEKQERIFSILNQKDILVYKNNPDNTDGEFASLMNLCNLILCSDSFALHIALSLRKKTIGLFFCSSVNEIEGYGILKKIVSPMQKDFFPAKQDLYDINLINSISAEQVLEDIKEIMGN